jgi:hypothetical protein
MLDGWVAGLLGEEIEPRSSKDKDAEPVSRNPGVIGGNRPLPILELARLAGASIASRAPENSVLQASWPSRQPPSFKRRPMLLGGAGLARLAVGQDHRALDLEIRGEDSYSGPHFQRLAVRISAAGQPVLDDLDEREATATGWELATASHNAVVVDGLNQRETPTLARTPAPGGNFLFFAADRDFQVVSIDDPQAYPQSTTRYRQTVVVSSSEHVAYALSVFEVHGGLQHDQIWHAAPGRAERWRLAVPSHRTSESLLPASITFLPGARPDQGRWFVQSYGEFETEARATLLAPSLAGLVAEAGPAEVGRARRGPAAGGTNSVPPTLLLHLLGDTPVTAFTATSPDPLRCAKAGTRSPDCGRRSSLIIRRRSREGESLITRFVTLIEPAGDAFRSLRRVGRVSSAPDVVVVLVETDDGQEYVLVNLKPGSTQRVHLPNGRYASFDGLALRVRQQALALAGGTFAEGSGRLVSQASLTGTITDSVRRSSERGLGWFLTPERLPDDPAVAGRTLIVQHGDGTSRCWTLDSIESTREGSRLHVREQPGFTIDHRDRAAHYYQFPQVSAPGPHRFRLAQIAR